MHVGRLLCAENLYLLNYISLPYRNKALLKEKEEIEEEFLRYRREIKNTPTGNAVKEIRMLKAVTKNLEEELMKEKTRHQRSTSKRSQEYRDLLEEVGKTVCFREILNDCYMNS